MLFQQSILKKGLILLFLLIAVIYLFSSIRKGSGQLSLQNEDVLQREEPPSTAQFVIHANDIVIKEFNISVNNYHLFGLEASVLPKITTGFQVVLLHGSSFYSSSWKSLGTMQLLATWGHQAIAIDLPGFGRSTKEAVSPTKRAEFLGELFWKLRMPQPVIVAPSVSGLFVAPFLTTYPDKLAGVVAVSASLPKNIPPKMYDQLEVPILVIFGERDKDMGMRVSDVLSRAPKCQVRMIPNSGSPAHLHQPEYFHKLLYNFLKYVSDQTAPVKSS